MSLELKRKLIELIASQNSDSDTSDSEENTEESDDCPERKVKQSPQERGCILPKFEGEGSNRPDGGLGCDRRFRAIEHALLLPEVELSSLRRDCRIVFALGSSNWLAADATPRCTLERLALAVFESRTAGVSYDPARSGAEWWAQVRSEGHPEEDIQFHWDVDESICDTFGLHVQPQISTVLYLTDCGAPTLILRVPGPRYVDSVARDTYGAILDGFISWPKTGKLISFDGELLHGTVPVSQTRAHTSEPLHSGEPRITVTQIAEFSTQVLPLDVRKELTIFALGGSSWSTFGSGIGLPTFTVFPWTLLPN